MVCRIKKLNGLLCFGKSFWSFHFIYWNGQNGLQMVWNGLKKNDVELFDFVNFEVI